MGGQERKHADGRQKLTRYRRRIQQVEPAGQDIGPQTLCQGLKSARKNAPSTARKTA
jgi:hypothetical protein